MRHFIKHFWIGLCFLVTGCASRTHVLCSQQEGEFTYKPGDVVAVDPYTCQDYIGGTAVVAGGGGGPLLFRAEH